MRRFLMLAACVAAIAPLAAQPAAAREAAPGTFGGRPIVIAHRGASGYRPEHTAMAYKLAIAQGADYVEPDLVMTKDGVLVARHENEIGLTTDVSAHPEFANRRVTRTIDGVTFTGWFAEDFTLAELKTLKSRERRPTVRPESAKYDDQEQILTLQEIIDIAKAGGAARGRPVGLYIELKNPDYHASLGLHMEPALVKVLQANGLNTSDAPVFIESFFPSALIALRKTTPVKLMFLVNSEAPPKSILEANHITNWPDVWSPEGLKKIAAFADEIGPETQIIFPRDADGRSKPATSFVADAHALGLGVHVWAVETENADLPLELRRGDPADPAGRGDGEALARALYEQGVDGVFTDNPDIVAKARDEVLARKTGR
jgi:glycerophosphoryl diester phosphodiesterase